MRISRNRIRQQVERFLPARWQQPSERLPEENAETFRQMRHAKKKSTETLYT